MSKLAGPLSSGTGPINRFSLLMLTLTCVLVILAVPSAQAQTFTVLHAFFGSEGTFPEGGLVMDAAGNIYGTTRDGGSGAGNVYKLSYRHGWLLNSLYNFQSGPDGVDPQSGVVFGPNGVLYGTTWNGGGNGCTLGCGTIFTVRPPATFPPSVLTPWDETVLHRFQGPPDAQNPSYGALVFDRSGAFYGAAPFGGNQAGCSRGSCGAVFKLTDSGGQWTEALVYSFAGDSDGAQPYGGVIFDNAGNLFGTTYQGGQYRLGTVFKLTPSNGGWTKTTLYQFTGGQDGGQPASALVRDSAGNYYGSTTTGGPGGVGGTIFELSPSGEGWNFSVLHSFGSGVGPFAPLTMDAAGNLYGTTNMGGSYSFGTVFELSPSANGWTYTVLHNFTGGIDGGLPMSSVLIGPDGVLYGTTYQGGNLTRCGNSGCGVVWQITL